MEIARTVKVLAVSVLPALVALAPAQLSVGGENMPAALASDAAGKAIALPQNGPDDDVWP
jgi:hypothetical protein